jgi:hypothetical protein
MAGKVSAKNAVILVNSQDISKDCVSFSIDQQASPIEVTGFTDGAKNFIPGMPVYGITLDLLWNETATTGAMKALQTILNGTTGYTVKITPEVGEQYISGTFMLDGLPATGTPTGALKIGSVHFSVFGSTAPTWAS